MAHDLLKIAEKCEQRTWRSPTESPLLADDFACFKDSAAALRAAHEEIEYFNSFRDELQTANTKLTLENRELRAELDNARNKPRCIKCGCTDIYTAFHKQLDCSYSSFNRSNSEHLHRTCRTCRYDWCEQTLDAIEAAMKEVGG